MNKANFVIINNRVYDSITGLPADEYQPTNISNLEQAAEKATKELSTRGTSVSAVHKSVQKSQTLRRKYVQLPAPKSQLVSAPKVETRNFTPMSLDRFTIKKASSIVETSQSVAVRPNSSARLRPAETHPVVGRATGKSFDLNSPRRKHVNNVRNMDTQARLSPVAPAQPAALKSAQVLKNEAILEAMNREVVEQKRSRSKAKRRISPFSRFAGVAVPALAILMLSGYFTYLSMPNLSIKMAAVQSGVNAKYPGYQPDGYALNGPITFGDGEVVMKFAYADGGHKFTLTQQKSSWNSASVKQLFAASPENVTATAVDGLTIYSQGGRAIWVNAGVLYTIDGEAALSTQQIQKIATSL